jgi:hypothetical protein
MQTILLTVVATTLTLLYFIANFVIYVFMTVDPYYETNRTKARIRYEAMSLLMFGVPYLLYSWLGETFYEMLADNNIIYLIKTLRQKQFESIQFDVAYELVRCYKLRPFTVKAFVTYLASKHIIRSSHIAISSINQ